MQRNVSLVQQALQPLQPLMRLTAALFMPSLREVDTVVQRLNNVVGQQLSAVPHDDTLSWIRGQLRRLIIQRLEEINQQPHYANNPLLRLLLSSGQERIQTVPIDVDPVSAINQRITFIAKGATDLLALRFSQRLPFVQIATQRMMSEEDVLMALQTACLQLDWTGDASGAPLAPTDYHIIDQFNSSENENYDLHDDFKKRILDDYGFALRTVRAVRLHVIASACYAPAVTVHISAPLAETKNVSAARSSTRSLAQPHRTTSNQLSATKNLQNTKNSRRKSAPRKTDNGYDAALEDYSTRSSRSSSVITIVSIVFVMSGILALILRYYLPGKSPSTIDAPSQQIVQPPKTSPTDQLPINAKIDPPPTKDEQVPPSEQPNPTKIDDKTITHGLAIGPVAAWSTRQVIKGYSGPLLRVRRSNDNKEIDIMATSSGLLDTYTLKEFAGSADALVSCWYDQSNNHYDMKQADTQKQPHIIKNGTLVVENTRPGILYNHDQMNYFTNPAAISIGSVYAVLAIEKMNNTTQVIMGSLSSKAGPYDSYYPMVDRSGTGIAEWFMGLKGRSCMVNTPIKYNNLFVYHGSTDGNPQPLLTLRINGKIMGQKQAEGPVVTPVGPTVVGATYWNNDIVDYINGVMGEIIIMPVGSSEMEQNDITTNLKKWWQIP